MSSSSHRGRDGVDAVDDDARDVDARDENIVGEASRNFDEGVDARDATTTASTTCAKTREEIIASTSARAARRRRRRRARGRGSTDSLGHRWLEPGTRSDAPASSRETSSNKTEADDARAMRDAMWAMTLEDEETVGFEFEARLEELWTAHWDAWARGEGGASSAASAAMDAFTKIVGGTSSSAIETGVRLVDASDVAEMERVDERACPVCLERFVGDARLARLRACEHTFCIDCIAPWLQRHSTCPMCRADVR